MGNRPYAYTILHLDQGQYLTLSVAKYFATESNAPDISFDQGVLRVLRKWSMTQQLSEVSFKGLLSSMDVFLPSRSEKVLVYTIIRP